MQPWYNYCDFHRKQGWSCTSIQQLQETMCKIKTDFLLPFVRDGVKSQEHSLRPLCPVETVAKGFSCGHLSGRDIMIFQLETESRELFISLNSSPRCDEHIKYHSSKKQINKLPCIKQICSVSPQLQVELSHDFSQHWISFHGSIISCI